MKINKHKYYTVSALDKHGHSLGIANQRKGFKSIIEIYNYLQAKNPTCQFGMIKIYDLWDRQEEIYRIKKAIKNEKIHFEII